MNHPVGDEYSLGPINPGAVAKWCVEHLGRRRVGHDEVALLVGWISASLQDVPTNAAHDVHFGVAVDARVAQKLRAECEAVLRQRVHGGGGGALRRAGSMGLMIPTALPSGSWTIA